MSKGYYKKTALKTNDASFQFELANSGKERIHPINYSEIAVNLHKSWTTLFATREAIRVEQQRQVITRAQPALKELLNAGVDLDTDQFFKKFVLLCVTMSGLGSPHSSAVVKETHPALNSVLKTEDIGRLIELPLANKEQNFLELVQVVMGIRLFNKDCHKGGEGIDDLPELLTRAVSASKEQLTQYTQLMTNTCQRLTATLLSIYPIDNNCSAVRLPSAESVPAAKISGFKSALCLAWMRYFYLRKLSGELSSSEQHIESCVDQLRQTLVQLHETVRYRVAIPTAQVYPLFTKLSLIWRELQYETAVLSHLNKLLKISSSSCETGTKNLILDRGAPLKSVTDPHFELKFRGFCPWTLVQTDGVLLAGSEIVENMAFRNCQSAHAWCKDGIKSNDMINLVLKNHRELAFVLDVVCDDPGNETQQIRKAITRVDAEVQTEMHPIKSYIERDYVWSDWDLKKKAVQLAKMTQTITKSQQTNISVFRRSQGTYLLK